MHIKSMRLDGFKSYAQPVEIKSFDNFFNAINGLNGSGKSNILDGICFVLGQSSVKSFRCENLQQLIYKNGQSGVTKATVSALFDNRNKSQSPIGLEDLDEFEVTRQIIIGGKTKYLLNGVTKTNTQIMDIFKTVSLSIQSSHFIIMQGRVTKVMNMKPMEVLGMLEETTGTKMYENKKDQAEKLIQKKDQKLQEITKCIQEDLTPTLEKLRNDRAAYIQYQKMEREIESCERRCLAYKVHSINESKSKKVKEITEIGKLVEECEEHKDEGIQASDEIREKIEQVESEKREKSGNALAELEQTLKDKEQTHTKSVNELKALNKELAISKKSLKTVEKERSGTEKLISDKNNSIYSNTGANKNLLERVEKAREELNFAEKRFDALSSGLEVDSSQGQAKSMAYKLNDFRSELAVEEGKSDTIKMKVAHAKKNLPKKRADLKKVETQANKDAASLKKLEDRFETCKYDMEHFKETTGFDESLEKNLEDKLNDFVRRKRNYDQLIQKTRRSKPEAFVEPRDPVNSSTQLNKNLIYGMMCKLFKVADAGRFSVALEKVLGGKMFNWIVENDTVGRVLITKSNKCFDGQVTALPLNNIRGKRVDRRKLEIARQIAGDPDLVHAAIDLVDFDPNLLPAMEFAFGDTLITSNVDIANKIAFHRDVRIKCVSLQGDVCNPSGALSGGAPSGNTFSILKSLSDLMELEDVGGTLEELKSKMGAYHKNKKTYQKLLNTLENAEQNYELTKSRLQASAAHRLLEEVNVLEAQVAEADQELAGINEIVKKLRSEIKQVETIIQNEQRDRDRKMKEAKVAVSKATNELKEAEESSAGAEESIAQLKAELDSLEKELGEYAGKYQEAQSEVENLNAKIGESNEIIKNNLAEVNEANAILSERKNILANHGKEISRLFAEVRKLDEKCRANDLRLKQYGFQLEKLKEQVDTLKKKRLSVLDEHSWLADEEDNFGKPGAYDFSGGDMEKEVKQLEKMKNTRERMEREVNTKAMNQLSHSQENYNELLKKKEIVVQDRLKILETIKTLDKKKRETVTAAFDKVNKNFRSIFETLLPGATAELRPCAGKSVLEGLEFRVGFNGHWKDNLSELSGGQRSLVALSLILGLLLLKPAPIYILDEIDAALDASHTANIGSMLSQHFKKSQFIIVSLKDGMFNNANVLYRTHFVNGVSSVTRHAKGQKGGPTSGVAGFAEGRNHNSQLQEDQENENPEYTSKSKSTVETSKRKKKVKN